MDSPQRIALDDVVLRKDLDPRLGERDADLIKQYAEIFDALPPIEVNQKNEVIDGWHRYLAARRVGVAEIACFVVETLDDDDLADRMWQSNLRHGVQYTRDQRKARGLKLYERRMSTSEIADRVGVSAATVRRWMKEQRERDRQQRNDLVIELAEQGKTQAEIAKESGVPQRTVSDILSENVQMRATAKEAESLENTDIEPEPEVAEADKPEPESEAESVPPEEISAEVLVAARAVMGAFDETRPDGYVARLEASDAEWMTITDDSLSYDLERELMTSAAAMCLWQEWMIWYQGESSSAFTDAFGELGPVFVRGQAGQWTIVSKLRLILRRIWA